MGLSKDSQKSVLKERRQSLIKRERSLPAIGRSMTGGGEGPSVAEVATSFPARLLGAIEEQWRFLNSQVKKKEEEEESNALENSKRSDDFLSQPDRAFIGR